tara:strand:+ start:580 stop:756 length:177 start_codon:yes stop_codon:yes gene_type:complete
MLVKFERFIAEIFAVIFDIKYVSSIVPEKPLVDVEAFPAIAPAEIIVEQELSCNNIIR